MLKTEDIKDIEKTSRFMFYFKFYNNIFFQINYRNIFLFNLVLYIRALILLYYLVSANNK